MSRKPPTKQTPPNFQNTRLFHDIAQIKAIVAMHFGYQSPDMTSRNRAEPLATIRQLAMYFARTITKASSPNVAVCFARADHTTVLHACRVIPEKLSTDEELKSNAVMVQMKIKVALSIKTPLPV